MNVDKRTELDAELITLENDVLPDLEEQLKADDIEDFERDEVRRERAKVKARIESLKARIAKETSL